MEHVILNNRAKMPKLGYDVYQIPVQNTEKCVLEAIEAGHRSIDTTQAYGNEDGVGNVLTVCSLPEEEFFITTRVWIVSADYEKARRFIDESLKEPKADYIDLLLIHQPFNDYYGAYRVMEEACGAGEIRAVGVNNFYSDCPIDLYRFVEIKPAINRVETHVFQQQKKVHKIMKRYGVQIGSWGPPAEGRKDFFSNSILDEIGSRYEKPAVQAASRLLIQRDVVMVPKTIHRERMEEDIDVFDFVLADEETEVPAELDQGESVFFFHYGPKTVEFLTGLGI